MANDLAFITVEVAFALPDKQCILPLQVQHGCSARTAVMQSRIAEEFPGLELASAELGIFGKNLDGKLLPLPQDYVLKPGDRVEIYRPLIADPKVSRAQRADKARKLKLKK